MAFTKVYVVGCSLPFLYSKPLIVSLCSCVAFCLAPRKVEEAFARKQPIPTKLRCELARDDVPCNACLPW